ncbi:DUF6090 family protein [Rhodohalobacter mucosus]|nr:DUF6090 family protein [Rhodohalobacter mucosus]
MEQNKVRKYTLYALGEILLVVVGILIALQINNWNEERINAQQEKIILQNLRSDLILEQQNLLSHIDAQNIWVDGGVYILRHFDDHSGFEIDTELLKRLNDLFARAGYVPVITTFETLENTGNIDLIQNEELKSEIVNYYQSIITFATNTQNNNADLVDGLVNHVLIELTFLKPNLFTDSSKDWFPVFDQVDYELQSNQMFLDHLQTKLSDLDNAARMINVVNFRILLANIQLSFAGEYLERTADLLELIEVELDK